MKYQLTMTMDGKTIRRSYRHRGQMSRSRMSEILDAVYFDNLPDYYPVSMATFESTSPPSRMVFVRIGGSNADGQWRCAGDAETER